jgi:hypothetical protein
MSLLKVLAAFGALYALYIPATIYLGRTYVPTGFMRYTTSRPFPEVEPGKFLLREEMQSVTPKWLTPEEASKIPVTVYEGQTLVGTGHWKLGIGILFSRDDGANPNDGEIKYYIQMPPFNDRKYATKQQTP